MARQLRLDMEISWSTPASAAVISKVESLSVAGNAEERGAVFTRPEVVEFILDLAGYTSEAQLHRQRVLEPSFGQGDFLLPVVSRLLGAWRRERGSASVVDELGDTLRAVELHRETYQATYGILVQVLIEEGLTPSEAGALADRWLVCDDFLLSTLSGEFDYIVGNPPYVRQELIPAVLLAEYRARYRTLYDRADLYVPFIERSLSLLAPEGSLALICSDRWMKNKYGGPLRKIVADEFHLRIYVDMVDTLAFRSEVTAYPAITVITRETPGPTRVAHRPAIDYNTLKSLADELRAPALSKDTSRVRELMHVAESDEPWLLGSSDQIRLIRRLEASFPRLEEAGCKIGIGVATGADRVFIGDYASLDVEPDRKLPLATTKDLVSGEVQWRGLGVINPFNDNGSLVNLEEYPRLRDYLQAHRGIIEARHCAQKAPESWYRTIDRITPALLSKPKLLVPDIKGEAHVVYEEGRLYPHHNLYYFGGVGATSPASCAAVLSSSPVRANLLH